MLTCCVKSMGNGKVLQYKNTVWNTANIYILYVNIVKKVFKDIFFKYDF